MTSQVLKLQTCAIMPKRHVFLFLFLKDRALLCRLGWPHAHKSLPASLLLSAGLKEAYTTTLFCFTIFLIQCLTVYLRPTCYSLD